MNLYWVGGILLFYVASCGTCYYIGSSGAHDADKAAQEAVDLKASEHVTQVTHEQETTTEGITNAHRTGIQAIDNLYATAPAYVGVQPAGQHDMPSLATATSGTGTAVCQTTSKKYKLTFKQCDSEELGYNLLWNDWQQQAAIK
jgi:hypothetical protein